MTEPVKKKRPEYRNLNLFTDLPTYRLPLAGLVSILHRVSGVVLLLLLPFIIWMFDTSLSSEYSFARFTAVFDGEGPFAGWFIKLVILALIWAFLHHLAAGVRHLVLDVTHRTTKPFGLHTAVATLVFSLLLTVLLGAKLFGLY